MKLDKTPITGARFKEVPTVEEFAKVFMRDYVLGRSKNKPSEVDKKRHILDNFIVPMLGPLKLDEVSFDHYEQFVARQLQAGMSAKTINNRGGVLSKMMHYAAESKLIGAMPVFKKVKHVRPDIRFLEAREVAKLLAALEETQPPKWAAAMIITALNTGLRVNELRALDWSAVDFRRRRIQVRHSLYKNLKDVPKTAAGIRSVPMNGATAEALKRVQRLGSAVFSVPPAGNRPSYHACKVSLKEAAAAAGLEGVGFHTLRHTFASHMVAAGQPLPVVQKLMGHTDITMTMRYVKATEDSLADACDVLQNSYRLTKG